MLTVFNRSIRVLKRKTPTIRKQSVLQCFYFIGHDDDVPLAPGAATSPAYTSHSRMEVSVIGSASDSNFSLHHHRTSSSSNSNVYQSLQSSDDRCSTDSGVSLSLRSSTGGASSGDERSGSRSSALSSTDETLSANHFSLSSGSINSTGTTNNTQSGNIQIPQTRLVS